MSNISWRRYINARINKKHRELLEEALVYVPQREEALDLGAGAMNDSRYLLANGFTHVTAIDTDDAAKEVANEFTAPNFLFLQSKIESFPLEKDTYDLINAQYSLPFIDHNLFLSVFRNIVQSLKREGVLCGQLFGTRDSANTPDTKTLFCTRKDVDSLFDSLHVIKLSEKKKMKKQHSGIHATGTSSIL